MGDTGMAHPATEPSNSHFPEDTSSASQREWERNTSGYIFESINASDLDITEIPKSGSTSKAEDTPTGAESPSNDGGAPRQSSTESNAPHHAPIGKDEAIAESNLINGDRLDNERFAPEEKESSPDHQIERSAFRPKFSCFAEYQQAYQASISNPEAFWASEAREKLHWFQDFVTTHTGSFESGNNAWFVEGRLNASYNCIDRHAFVNPESLAIIYEADEPGQDRKLTYGDLLGEVSRLAFVLVDLGVAKGDIVVIYLPNIPEALIAMLACARIGAIHSVVFMGFSSMSLQDRIRDAKSKVVITSDEARRGGKAIPTKRIVNDALLQYPLVQKCIVLKHTGLEVPWSDTRDVWWHEEARKWPPYFPPVSLSAEDPLFLLYTSGSTGKPKGLMHTTAGYLVGAAITTEYVFNMHRSDVHFCAGDVGWITGHTYLVYGPLLLGATTIVFEGTPTYPTFSRLWNIIDHHNVTHFYAAPTVLRILKRAGEPITAPMEHLRVLGSIGEPIAPEVWRWYHETVGKKKAYVVDTYFQTETGCHVIAPFAQAIPVKPGCCTVPFLGIEPGIIDPHSGLELEGNGVEGILAIKRPWPSMARTVWKAHERYMDTYFKLHPGYYFTGDGAYRDEDGYYWIRGRVDDVVNVSGHRLSTAELEAALLESGIVAEAAVVGINDSMTGQALAAYVSLKKELEPTLDLQKILIEKVHKTIGAFAAPKLLCFVTDLPKTRSGKIMRRILKKILEGERDDFGDTSTLINSESISTVIREVERPATTVSAQ